MKNLPAAVLCVFFVGISLVLQACALITSPITTTVLGGAQLAIKGTELQKEIRKADVRKALDSPFENTWNMASKAMVDLRIEITRSVRTDKDKGGLIEGRAQKIKVKLVVLKLTEDITEIGIWTEHDKALAELIADKIREEVEKQILPLGVSEVQR